MNFRRLMTLVISLVSLPLSLSFAVPSGATLQPGTGWSGLTSQPGPVGSGPGSDRRPIAHWDAVPYVTVRPGEIYNVGILAYHINDINRVEFSINNGPWLAIDSPAMNPQTKAEEYWVRVDPSVFPQSGRYEMRARVYPNAGLVRVLQSTLVNNESTKDSSLFVNIEKISGDLPHTIRYATVSGSDSNPCTQSQPCQTLGRAIASAAISNSIDGAEIRLGEGTWHNGALSTLGGYQAPNQWLTITSAPGANPDNVKITGWATQNQIVNYKLVRFHNLRIVEQMVANFNQYIWFDSLKIIDERPTAMQVFNQCWHPQAQFSGVWITDVYVDQMCYSPSGTLVRNVFVDRSAAGYMADATPTIVNVEHKLIYGSGYYGIDYHGDIVHFFGNGPAGPSVDLGSEDRILYGLIVKPTGNPVAARGIAAEDQDQLDIAIVNSDLHATSPPYAVFSMCGTPDAWNTSVNPPRFIPERFVNHFVILNSRFVGGAQWCAEAGVPPIWTHIDNVRIENSIFENGSAEKMVMPINTTKIRYSPGIGGSNTGVTVISPNGTITKSPNQTTYGSGATVSLQATPLPGYQFDHWVGDLTGMSSFGSVTLPTSGAARVKYAHAYFIPSVGGGGTNQPPQVNAGADQSVTFPSGVNLIGSALDDGRPDPPGALNIHWSKISGPGNVNFSDISSTQTSATFSETGTYILRLTADDTELSRSDDVQVTNNNDPVGNVNYGETRFLPCGDFKTAVQLANPCLQYALGHASRVQISIYSRDGKLVSILKDEDQNPGIYTVNWNTNGIIGSGGYNVVLKADSKTLTQKIVVIK